MNCHARREERRSEQRLHRCDRLVVGDRLGVRAGLQLDVEVSRHARAPRAVREPDLVVARHLLQPLRERRGSMRAYTWNRFVGGTSGATMKRASFASRAANRCARVTHFGMRAITSSMRIAAEAT